MSCLLSGMCGLTTCTLLDVQEVAAECAGRLRTWQIHSSFRHDAQTGAAISVVKCMWICTIGLKTAADVPFAYLLSFNQPPGGLVLLCTARVSQVTTAGLQPIADAFANKN